MGNEQMYPGWEALYILDDGHYIRIYNTIDDDEYPYGYDHFGADMALIDGGVLDIGEEPSCPEDVLRSVLEDCDYSPNEPFRRIDEGDGPIDMEALGFEGY